MNTQRKLQLCAATVIANGLMALGAMTPTAALAAACTANTFTVCLNPSCSVTCPAVSGCTVTKYCNVPICGPIPQDTLCYYT
jgi:hypothetical protein